MRKVILSAMLGAVALMGLPSTSHAQRGGRGGGNNGSFHSGGGFGGGYYGGGYHGGGYYGGGFYGRGYYGGGYYGRGYYGDYGLGLGLTLGYPGYGYNYSYASPYYGSSYYYAPNTYGDLQSVAPTTSYYQPEMAPTAPVPHENPNVVNLEVRVPENAALWVEGQPTDPTGSTRHFYSPQLQPGRTYTYHVHARWTDANGKVVDRTKAVDVRAGERIGVDFNNQ
jgi:uncharacterized protein (TIGR03000 family)